MRDEHRRRDQRSYSSRRSSTDSSEEGINLNIRDLKVRIPRYLFWILNPNTQLGPLSKRYIYQRKGQNGKIVQ